MNDTAIAWTDKTWNPVSGCHKISPGCAYCYAETLAERFRGQKAFPDGFECTYRPHRLKEPFAHKRARRVFVNSMSDFFWERISDQYRDSMLETIRRTPQHHYQVLTKRPEEMQRFFSARPVPSNMWLGVSVESQALGSRIDVLRQVDADIRFVSVEPMLGPVDLDLNGIDWVIVGGESGMHLFDASVAEKRSLVRYAGGQWIPRDDRVDWIRRLRDQCVAKQIAFFFKQWGGAYPMSAGNELDGQAWEQHPRPRGQGK